jgi:hypothetical protein
MAKIMRPCMIPKLPNFTTQLTILRGLEHLELADATCLNPSTQPQLNIVGMLHRTQRTTIIATIMFNSQERSKGILRDVAADGAECDQRFHAQSRLSARMKEKIASHDTSGSIQAPK